MLPQRVVFPYLAQTHQILHSLPIAAALAIRHPGIRVHLASVNPGHLDFARRLVHAHAPGSPLHYDLLPLGPGDGMRLRAGWGASHFKQYTLLRNRHYFAGFDAVVTPERTSLFLRHLGIPAHLIWTRHGAGDREVGFKADVRHFDFVLFAGRKIEQRLLSAGLIHPGRYVGGIYAKFEWASAPPMSAIFDNSRPTVLYNPHFLGRLSSWARFGREVLEVFADSSRYNLIFAPHVRLFEASRESEERKLASLSGLSHLRIDLGSERSVDMHYTKAADFYLGDVSSQVAEFVCQPRPCGFLDAHATQWRGNPNFRSWTLGPVWDSTLNLEQRIGEAMKTHAEFLEVQRRYVDETFEPPTQDSGSRGADAIAEFLSRYPVTRQKALQLPITQKTYEPSQSADSKT